MSLKPKMKLCDGCGEPRVIWKNHEGKRYCKFCWSCHEGNTKLKPTAPQKPIPSRSPKRSKEEKIYSGKRIIFLAKYSMCQAHLPGCTSHSTEVHHKAGRIGDLLLDETKWLATCRSCHQWIELHPDEAKEKGLSLSRLNTNNEANNNQ